MFYVGCLWSIENTSFIKCGWLGLSHREPAERAGNHTRIGGAEIEIHCSSHAEIDAHLQNVHLFACVYLDARQGQRVPSFLWMRWVGKSHVAIGCATYHVELSDNGTLVSDMNITAYVSSEGEGEDSEAELEGK